MSGEEAEKPLHALKLALQCAKELHDAGLVDDSEFKDLKSHELLKYKNAISSTANSEATKKQLETIVTPVTSEQTIRMRKGGHEDEAREDDTGRKGETEIVVGSQVEDIQYRTPSPQIRRVASLVKGNVLEEMCSVKKLMRFNEPSIFEKLTTPPIFKRRARRKKRTIVLDSKEIETL